MTVGRRESALLVQEDEELDGGVRLRMGVLDAAYNGTSECMRWLNREMGKRGGGIRVETSRGSNMIEVPR